MSDEKPPHKIQFWKTADLIPYKLNAKKHPPEQVEKLARAIRKFGWTQPIVIWKNGEIIAGHGRRLAAIELGQDKVPVVVRGDLTRAEADALRLSDNRVSSTEYDQKMIQDELTRLMAEDIDLMDLGFDEKEIEFSVSDLGEIDDSFFTDDIAGDVEKQREENEKGIEVADDAAAPITDALGFKRVKVAQSRVIRELMTKIEATGNDPVEGFILILQKGLAAA